MECVLIVFTRIWEGFMKLFAAAMLVAGLAIGVCVGIVGTGGAFIIPVLVYVFQMGQLKAQGTALLVAAFPIWFFAFIPYWRAGHYDLKTALLLSVGIGAGGYLGAKLVQDLPQEYVRKAFAVALFALSARMFFER
jgi:uncharacterized protein